MKKNKHILINLTESEYEMIQAIAIKDRRKITEVAYLILQDGLKANAYKFSVLDSDYIKQ